MDEAAVHRLLEDHVAAEDIDGAPPRSPPGLLSVAEGARRIRLGPRMLNHWFRHWRSAGGSRLSLAQSRAKVLEKVPGELGILVDHRLEVLVKNRHRF